MVIFSACLRTTFLLVLFAAACLFCVLCLPSLFNIVLIILRRCRYALGTSRETSSSLPPIQCPSRSNEPGPGWWVAAAAGGGGEGGSPRRHFCHIMAACRVPLRKTSPLLRRHCATRPSEVAKCATCVCVCVCDHCTFWGFGVSGANCSATSGKFLVFPKGGGQ